MTDNKAVIDFKLYNTEGSTYIGTQHKGRYIAHVDYSCQWWDIYKTAKGAYFKVHHWAGGMSQFDITTTTEEEVKQILGHNPELYAKTFGVVEVA